MIPSITIGIRTISAYMICAIIGIFAAGIVTLRKYDKTDKFNLELTIVMLWSAPGAIIGAHLLYGVTNLSNIVIAIQKGADFISIVSAYFGGSVFYGGLLGGLASAVIYCKIAHIDFRKYINSAALFVPLFHFFGRLGCFLTGCCFGMESHIGFIYKYSPIAEANNVVRFPIQLVEALGNLIIFLIILKLYENVRFRGRLLSLYFILYSVLRFTTEFFRGDEYRGFLFSLSTSQIISIVLFIVGWITFIRKKRALCSAETDLT